MLSSSAMVPWMAIAAVGVLGLVFGSFLNVCIARLPLHTSVVRPRSRCSACGQTIRIVDNIPVLSWVRLRGRCHHCRSWISVRYPLVECGTAALWLGCLLQTGFTWQTFIDIVACFFLLGLAVMDAETMLLPDAFTLTGIVLAVLLRAGAPNIPSRMTAVWQTLADATLGACLLVLVLVLYWTVRRQQGLGWGDVKLLAMITAFLGLPLTGMSFFLGVLSAAAFALFLVLRRGARGEDRLPFGSFLAGAAIVSIFAGRPLLMWYLTLLR